MNPPAQREAAWWEISRQAHQAGASDQEFYEVIEILGLG